MKVIIKATKGFGRILRFIIFWCMILLSILLFYSIKWMLHTWNNLKMSELMYQLKAPIAGTNKDMIVDFVNNCVVKSCVMFTIIVIFYLLLIRNKKRVVRNVTAFLSMVLIVYSVGIVWYRLDISTYIRNECTYSKFVDNNYVNPKSVTLEFPDKKRNLVYIFLESMEVTYSQKEEGGAFEQGCIPELASLAKENICFSSDSEKINGGFSMPYTTWTVAGMFAQMSGLPLKTQFGQNDMESQTKFFPKVITLGDILKENGYNQVLLLGSAAQFGGRKQLFRQHGDYSIHDLYYEREVGNIPQDYNEFWGYEDEKLFEFAKAELMELSSHEEPFSLVFLTADTHFEDGYVCRKCNKEFGENQYANVMRCSSRQVSDFIVWIQNQDFFENTTVILAGDHPTMDSNFCDNIDEKYTRRVYTTIINPISGLDVTGREYSTFDNFPTVLAAMGIKIEVNQLGLGVNLFSDKETLVEKYGNEYVERELYKRSELLDDLYGIDWIEWYVSKIKIETMRSDVNEQFFTVSVGEVLKEKTNMDFMFCRVFTREDYSDGKEFMLEKGENGKYVADIDMSLFDNGYFYIDSYLVTKDGTRYYIGRNEMKADED